MTIKEKALIMKPSLRPTHILSAATVIMTVMLMSAMSCRSVSGPGHKTFDSSARQRVLSTVRQVVNFNGDWKFTRVELSTPASRDFVRAEPVDFDDSNWAVVKLPHDWAIAGPFNPALSGSSGKLPWQGVGWYRKRFTLDKADSGKRIYFDFDGVMAFPQVYINGQIAGEWDYGYMSFRVDATRFVKFGEQNVIAVLVDTRRHGTRWYPGAGIYRKVVMTMTEPIHVANWGIYITTPQISDSSAKVNVLSAIENHLDTESKIEVEVVLSDPAGKIVAGGKKDGTIPAGGSGNVEQMFEIKKPQLWDITSPKLYAAKVIVRAGGKIVDVDFSTFGIRTFRFTADDGFHLNGRRVQIKGVCLHHDHGPLGAAFYTRAMERQLEIMRDMGVNAIRTSHNPPAPELLDLCDRMGFVVWDECFDKWDATADRVNNEPVQEYNEKQFRNFVMRDRNHPSIVIWSICNEISGLTDAQIRPMADIVRKYDATRAVGMACNDAGSAERAALGSLDVMGWNYGFRYRQAKDRYPDQPEVMSESASALSSRGFYELPLVKIKNQYSEQLQVDSYDRNAARWADIPDVDFNKMETDKYMAGEFVWTGFDYLGEPTPFTQQARSSYFGIVDLCGIPKDRYYLYRSHWAADKVTVHILPHWNWPDRIGKTVPVYVYTNGDSAELFLNGKSLGRRTKIKEVTDTSYYGVIDKYRLRWLDVVYEPGELRAVAYKDGKKIGSDVVRTAGSPAAVRLTPDRKKLSASGEDLCYILIEAVDDKGTLCPLADNTVRFKIDGPARIAGADNGNPLSMELIQDDNHKLFFGKAMLVLQTEDSPGRIIVTVEGDGLKPAKVTLQSR